MVNQCVDARERGERESREREGGGQRAVVDYYPLDIRVRIASPFERPPKAELVCKSLEEQDDLVARDVQVQLDADRSLAPSPLPTPKSSLCSLFHPFPLLHLIMLRTISRTSQRSLSRSLFSARSYSTEIDPQGPSFGLSEDQAAFQQLARGFTEKEITPVAAEYDRSMKVRSLHLQPSRSGAPAAVQLDTVN
jgi:hypothetical protein